MASVQKVAHRFEDKERSDDVKVQDDVNFSTLLLSPLVQDGLMKSGFVKPSPIQLQAIPLGKLGLDLIVQAKSGTGKTCIFAVIALENIRLECLSVQTLVLAPTREIASQICDVILSIASCFPSLHCHYFIGGLPLAADRVKLKKCQIAIGTPGRIKQLIECKCLNTDSIRLFVLDEADKLLDKDFQQCINWIYQKLPHNKQILALSATYPESLANLLVNYMRNPAFVRLNTQKPSLLGIIQFYTITKCHPLPHVTFQYKLNMLSDILINVPFSQCLIFINLQSRAQLLCDKLNKEGWASMYICGNQNQVQRLKTMTQLKSFQCRILVTTDLTARGIDCQNVDVVINVDFPGDLETYLHRIGRAGRFGSKGLAITIVSEGNEKERLFSMNSSASLDICVLPKPLSATVWKFNSKIVDSPTMKINNEPTKADDSLICILNNDLFSNEKKNKKSENLDDNYNTVTNEVCVGNIGPSNVSVLIAKSNEVDIDINIKQCLTKGDNIKKKEYCDGSSILSKEDIEGRTQNHNENIPLITFNSQQNDDLKNCIHVQEQTSLSNTNEPKNPRETSRCFSESVINLKLMDINNCSTKNMNIQQESNNINEIMVNDFSQFYTIKSHAKDISYSEILEELDNLEIGKKYSSEQYIECIPSEKLLQKVKCFLTQSHQFWKSIGTFVNSNDVTEDEEQKNTLFPEIYSSKDESQSIPENEVTFPSNIKIKKVVDDDNKIINGKIISLPKPEETNLFKKRNEVLDNLKNCVQEYISPCNYSFGATEEINIANIASAPTDHLNDISLLKLNESNTCKEGSNSTNEILPNSSNKEQQISYNKSNLDSPIINRSSVADTSTCSLSMTKFKKCNKQIYKQAFSNSPASTDSNINYDMSENCKVSVKSLLSGDESDYSYSSRSSESEETINNENSLNDRGNVDSYNPQDNYMEEILSISGNSFAQAFPPRSKQQQLCVCNKNTKDGFSSNCNMSYGKAFHCKEDKRSFEHLVFTPDGWQQSDYGYCSAKGESNYGQFLHQNYSTENSSSYCHSKHCGNKQFIYPELLVKPQKIHRKPCCHKSCCKYCYWQLCYSSSREWCYRYNRYMSEMLKWRKYQQQSGFCKYCKW